MANSGSNKLKTLLVYQYLMDETDENNQANASDIIKYLSDHGVSSERKAIYKEIEALQEAGYDVVKGEKGYYMGSRLFEVAELKLLVDAIGSSKFISEKKSRDLLKKMGKLASKSEARLLSRQVVVPDRVKTENEKILYVIDVIYNCIDSNHKMTFQYEDWTIEKKKVLRHNGELYKVSPEFLIRNDENYYMVAFDDKAKAIRHYRVDKMINAKELEEVREGKEEREALSKAEYAKKNAGMFSGREATVTLRAHKDIMGVLFDKYGTDITVRSDGDYIKARVTVAISPQFYGDITGIGAVITAPKDEADKYREYLNVLMMEMN